MSQPTLKTWARSSCGRINNLELNRKENVYVLWEIVGEEKKIVEKVENRHTLADFINLFLIK